MARTLLAELPELGSLDRRQIATAGRPGSMDATVGKMAKARASSAAAEARYAPSYSWAPWWPADTTPTSRPSATGWSLPAKPKIVAIVATMRKLLTILNAIIRDGQPWQNA